MPTGKSVRSTAMGALIAYGFLHPLSMVVGHLMSAGPVVSDGAFDARIWTAVMRSFSAGMLPWSLAFAFFGGALGFYIQQNRQASRDRSNLIVQLQASLAEIKKLSGLLPICASCKRIRDDQGHWSQIESYIREHSEAEFTHGICPACARKLYPDIFSDAGTP